MVDKILGQRHKSKNTIKSGKFINHIIVIHVVWFMQLSTCKRNVRKHIQERQKNLKFQPSRP